MQAIPLTEFTETPTVRGFVPTPEAVVDLMVDKLFRASKPTVGTVVLDPGCGRGAFIDGILRWCARTALPMPRVLGVELNPAHVRHCRQRFASNASISIVSGDFLSANLPEVDLVVGNPPYVPITGLGEAEKIIFRKEFATARGRFDLYSLFFERSLGLLRPNGRLVFITPEKFLYVESAQRLRGLLSSYSVEELHLLDERTFDGLVTYPLITTVEKSSPVRATRVTDRAGESRLVSLRGRDTSWQPILRGGDAVTGAVTLESVSMRVSCGVATGADSVFVHRTATLPEALRRFAHPTIAGRELRTGGAPRSLHSLLVPYDLQGQLLAESSLGAFRDFLRDPTRLKQLKGRTCVKRKPWYAFHETPPLAELLRPKILCKDIGPRPSFFLDRDGSIVPRHSVYYIVPRETTNIGALLEYLNSEAAVNWLENHCQRAANGFVRLQSSVLKRLPMPAELGREMPTHRARRARTA